MPTAEYQRQWRKDHPEYRVENRKRSSRHRIEQPEKRKEQKRRAFLKCKYGITPEWYEEKVIKQRGLCAICKVKPEGPLDVDHDHNSGLVRGLLCRNCNWLLAQARDNIETLKSAAKYLWRNSNRI